LAHGNSKEIAFSVFYEKHKRLSNTEMENYKGPHVPKPSWTLTHHCPSLPKPRHCSSNVLCPHLETELAQHSFGLHSPRTSFSEMMDFPCRTQSSNNSFSIAQRMD